MSNHLTAQMASHQIADRLRAADRRRLLREARRADDLDYEPATPTVRSARAFRPLPSFTH
jgi:hypothetical protein